MFYSSIAVFQEIQKNDQTLFQWFRVATPEEEGYIIPSELLSEDEHWERLAID